MGTVLTTGRVYSSVKNAKTRPVVVDVALYVTI